MSEWGCSRLVFKVGGYALKLPNFRYGWRAFLRGLMHNMDEATVWRVLGEDGRDRSRLCPVAWACPGGWFLVMPWAPVGRDGEHDLLASAFGGIDENTVREMLKADNVGLLHGKWVVVDYAGW